MSEQRRVKREAKSRRQRPEEGVALRPAANNVVGDAEARQAAVVAAVDAVLSEVVGERQPHGFVSDEQLYRENRQQSGQ